MLGLVTSFCRSVAHLGEQHLAYTGPWRLGLLIDRLTGIRATDAIEDFELGLDLEGFPSPEYLETAACFSLSFDIPRLKSRGGWPSGYSGGLASQKAIISL